MARFEYIPVKGARISSAEAETIGIVIERMRLEGVEQRFMPDRFLDICRDPDETVHTVWKRIRDSERAAIDRRASDYLLRSVDVIEIVGGQPRPPQKAVYTVKLTTTEPAVSVTLRDARRDLDVQERLIRLFHEDVTRLIRDLESVVGSARTAVELNQVLEELYPAKPKGRG
jgi:hypothetical protein